MDASLKATLFYHISVEYKGIIRKKDKNSYLTFVLEGILPKVGIEGMHRKSLIRRLSSTEPQGLKRTIRGRKPPYLRLIDSPDVSTEDKQELANKRANLNPFKLQVELQKKLTKIHQLIAEAQFKQVS